MQSGIQQQEGGGFGMGGFGSDFAQGMGGIGGMGGMGGFLPGSYEQMQAGGMQAQAAGGMMPMQAQNAMVPIGGLPMAPLQVQNPMMGGFAQMQGMSPYAGLSPVVPIPYMRPPIVGPFGLLYDETERA